MQHPRFCAAPSLVGSFPHTDPRALVEEIFRRFTVLPAWPQLPARDWLESMYVQYSEGLPGAVVDRATQRIYFASGNGFEGRLEAFYQAVVEEDVERFRVVDAQIVLRDFVKLVRQHLRKHNLGAVHDPLL